MTFTGGALETILQLVFPPRCVACDARCEGAAAFCNQCALGVDAIVDGCPRCALPLAHRTICLQCGRQPPPFASARAAFAFGGPVADSVRRLKFADQPSLARPLGRLMPPAAVENAILVPVPLHPRRLRSRGYNQAALLALAIAPRRRVALDVLMRVRDTPPQTTLDAK